MAELLLKIDEVDIDEIDAYRKTPLMWAARNGHEAIVKLLLEKGADANGKNVSNGTLLMWAAEWGHRDIAKLLLKKEAEANGRNVNSHIPLLVPRGRWERKASLV